MQYIWQWSRSFGYSTSDPHHKQATGSSSMDLLYTKNAATILRWIISTAISDQRQLYLIINRKCILQLNWAVSKHRPLFQGILVAPSVRRRDPLLSHLWERSTAQQLNLHKKYNLQQNTHTAQKLYIATRQTPKMLTRYPSRNTKSSRFLMSVVVGGKPRKRMVIPVSPLAIILFFYSHSEMSASRFGNGVHGILRSAAIYTIGPQFTIRPGRYTLPPQARSLFDLEVLLGSTVCHAFAMVSRRQALKHLFQADTWSIRKTDLLCGRYWRNSCLLNWVVGGGFMSFLACTKIGEDIILYVCGFSG